MKGLGTQVDTGKCGPCNKLLQFTFRGIMRIRMKEFGLSLFQ